MVYLFGDGRALPPVAQLKKKFLEQRGGERY
jgi:hypothetical protein